MRDLFYLSAILVVTKQMTVFYKRQALQMKNSHLEKTEALKTVHAVEVNKTLLVIEEKDNDIEKMKNLIKEEKRETDSLKKKFEKETERYEGLLKKEKDNVEQLIKQLDQEKEKSKNFSNIQDTTPLVTRKKMEPRASIMTQTFEEHAITYYWSPIFLFIFLIIFVSIFFVSYLSLHESQVQNKAVDIERCQTRIFSYCLY